MNTTLSILTFYLVGILAIAWFFSRRQSLDEYFLNERSTSLWLMTFSTVTSIFGAGALVPVVAETYNSGISFGFALPIALAAGALILGIVAYKIKEVGEKYNAHTIVDFFRERFDRKNEVLTGVLQLFLLSIWIGIQAVAISALASVVIGVSYTTALLIAAGVTVLYTAIGGLKVDIITDFIQFWVMVGILGAMSIIGINEIGGLGNMLQRLPEGHLDFFAFGGPMFFFGIILVSGFLFLGNTSHWQRIFSAASPKVARKSFFFAVPLVVVLGVLTISLGLTSSILLLDVDPDKALFALIDALLSPELAGIGFAVILAVVMSSIDSLLVGGSTIIHRALFRRTETSSAASLSWARLLTGLFGIAGFAVAFLIPDIVTLSLLVTYQALIFVPPIFAAFYTRKISADASFYSITIPTIVLLSLFWFIGENIFLLTTLLGVAIIIGYPRIFERRRINSV